MANEDRNDSVSISVRSAITAPQPIPRDTFFLYTSQRHLISRLIPQTFIDSGAIVVTEIKNISRCDLCGRDFQFGPQKYDGKFISRYQLSVCMPCYVGNWDGWAPHYEEKILLHLKSEELPIPERNLKGWLPRD